MRELKALGESRAAEVRSAWRRVWHIHDISYTGRYTHAVPVGNRNVAGAVNVHWLFLDRDRILYTATSNGSASCVGAAIKAARNAVVLDEAVVGQPQVSLTSPTGAVPFLVDDTYKALGYKRNFNTDQVLMGELFVELMAEFAQLLDPEALQSAILARRKKKASPPSLGGYNLFAGAHAGENAQAKALWRRKAVAALPLFSNDIRFLPQIVDAIDSSAPLVDALARRRGVRAITVRALSGWPMGDGVRPKAFGQLCSVVDATPPDWIPRTVADWQALVEFAQMLSHMGMLAPQSEVGAQVMASKSQPDPEVVGARTRLLNDTVRRNGRDWGAALRESPHLRAAVAHVGDTGLALCVEVVLPHLLSTGWRGVDGIGEPMTDAMRALGRSVLVAGRSPRSVLRISASHLERYMAAVPDAGQDVGARSMWLPLGADAQAESGLAIHNLSTQAQLSAEGNAMGHCVGSYANMCSDGLCRILGVREPDGQGGWRSLSTAEIRVGSGGHLAVAQHRGPANRQPDGRAVAALEWYLAELGGGRIEGNTEALAAIQATANRRRHNDDYYELVAPNQMHDLDRLLGRWCGYNHNDAGARAAVWANWSRVLGVRQADVGSWLAGLGPDVWAAWPAKGLHQAMARSMARALPSAIKDTVEDMRDCHRPGPG